MDLHVPYLQPAADIFMIKKAHVYCMSVPITLFLH
jgi:hypothetical protein